MKSFVDSVKKMKNIRINQFNLRIFFNYLLIVISSLVFGFFVINRTTVQAQSQPETFEEMNADMADFYQCMGDALAEFMLSILDAKMDGRIPPNVRLLSPAFNMTSFTLQGIVNGMYTAGGTGIFNHPALYGIAGNIYNTAGEGGVVTIPQHIQNQNLISLFNTSLPFIITETGNTIDGGNNQQVIQAIVETLSTYPQFQGMALFNPTVTNPSFQHHDFREDLYALCQAVESIRGNCNAIGINYGTYFGSTTYDDATNYNMGYVVQIINNSPSGIQSAINSINSFGNPGTNGGVVLRPGTASDDSGIGSVEDYINFLAEVGNGANGQIVYALAGPNEPDAEFWIAPQCAYLLPEWYIKGGYCEGPVDYDVYRLRGEVIGHNIDKPFLINANIREEIDGTDDLDDLADKLRTDFTISVSEYYHDDFEVVSQQMTTSLDSSSPNYYGDRTSNKLMATYPALNSIVIGKKIPGSYGVGDQEPYNPAIREETYEQYLKRVYSTNTGKDGEEYGLKTKMPTVTFIGCIQRTSCNPKEEECLNKATNAKCGEDEDPNNCISYGKTFSMNGLIEYEEPPDLQSISRSFDFQKRNMVDSQYKKFTMNNIFTKDELQQAELVYEKDLENYAGINPLELRSQNTYNPDQIMKNKVDIVDKAFAQTPGIQPTITFGVRPIQTGAFSYNIEYQLCMRHEADSNCSIRDVWASVNGTEIFWTASTTTQFRCVTAGDGGLPSISGVLEPGGSCININYSVQGGRVGPEGCMDRTGPLSCEICMGLDGKINQTCGVAPEPEPVNCKICTSWAPDYLCQPILADDLINEKECADGRCKNNDYYVEDQLPYDENNGIHIDFGGPEWTGFLAGIFKNLADVFGISYIDCDIKDEEYDQNGVKTQDASIDCSFNSRHYMVFAYPTYIEADFSNRTSDMAINHALFKINNKTNQFFVPKSTKQPVYLQLQISDIAAEGGSQTLKPTTNMIVNGDKPEKNSFHIGLNDSGSRLMFVEYPYFFQPQTSAQCLKQKLMTIQRDSENMQVPDSHNSLCNTQTFWMTGQTQGGTATNYYERELSYLNKRLQAEGDLSVNLSEDAESGGIAKTTINLEEELVPFAIGNDIESKKAQKNNPILTANYIAAREALRNDVTIIMRKYSYLGKEVLNTPSKWPIQMQRDLETLARNYQNRL